MKRDWVSPLDAMRELGCMSFGKRVAEIRKYFLEDDNEYVLKEQWVKRINRFGEKVQYKEFRLTQNQGAT